MIIPMTYGGFYTTVMCLSKAQRVIFGYQRKKIWYMVIKIFHSKYHLKNVMFIVQVAVWSWPYSCERLWCCIFQNIAQMTHLSLHALLQFHEVCRSHTQSIHSLKSTKSPKTKGCLWHIRLWWASLLL